MSDTIRIPAASHLRAELEVIASVELADVLAAWPHLEPAHAAQLAGYLRSELEPGGMLSLEKGAEAGQSLARERSGARRVLEVLERAAIAAELAGGPVGDPLAPAPTFEPGARVIATIPTAGGPEHVAGTVVEDRSGVRAIHNRGAEVHVHFDGRTSPVPFRVAQLRPADSAPAAIRAAAGLEVIA